MLTKEIHQKALNAAHTATVQMLEDNPESWFPCGFAWVKARVKGNTALGKSFKACGFSKSYNGGYDLWNPSGHGTQWMTAKAAGAQAYADVVCEALGNDSIVIAQERMD